MIALASAASPPALYARARAALGLAARTSIAPLERQGEIFAGGITGTIDCLQSAAAERCESRIGGRDEILVRRGERYFRRDASGFTRALDGAFLQHERTFSAIESGEFLFHPEWAQLAPPAAGLDSGEDWVAVQPPGSEREYVGFDRQSALPVVLRSRFGGALEQARFEAWTIAGDVRYPAQITVAVNDAPEYRIHFEHFDPAPRVDAERFTLPQSQTVALTHPITVGLQKHDDHWYVPVEINGRRYQFLLDSGSQAIVLDRSVAAAVHIRPQGAFAVAATNTLPGAGYAGISDLRIGAADFGPQLAVVTDIGLTSDGGAHIAGVLGFPIFAQAALRVDSHAATMTIGAPGSLAFRGLPLNVSFDRGVIETDAAIDGGPQHAHFILDTGSADTVIVHQAFYARHPGIAHRQLQTDRTYGIGGSVGSIEAVTAGLQVRGLPKMTSLPTEIVQSHAGAFADENIAGSLGMGFLQAYRLDCDVQHGVVMLEPIKAADTAR